MTDKPEIDVEISPLTLYRDVNGRLQFDMLAIVNGRLEILTSEPLPETDHV